jgi:hypothetical protein
MEVEITFECLIAWHKQRVKFHQAAARLLQKL